MADDAAKKNAAEKSADETKEAEKDGTVTESDVERESDSDEDVDAASDDAVNWDEDDSPNRFDRRRLAWLATAVAVIAVCVTTSVLTRLWWDEQRTDEAGRQALAAAENFAGVLTNVDTAKLDENFNQTMDGSTGEFKDMYAKSSTQLKQILIENKAAAHGIVHDSAVKSASVDKVEVLLFIDQSVMNSTLKDPRMDRSRVKMTMEKIDGRWLASKVELP